eukprot:354107-Ditylum_brightwellii.AAC.1
MAPKPNHGLERKSNTEREETEQKDHDMGSPENKTQLSARGRDLAKGPRPYGSNSSNNTVAPKSNNGAVVESNNKREGNEQTDNVLESSENEELDFSCLQALEHGSSPNNTTQTNCKSAQISKEAKPRRPIKQGGTAEARTGGMHKSLEDLKTDGQGSFWKKST